MGYFFCGKFIKNVVYSVDFVFLYIESNGKEIYGWDLLFVILNLGDVLYLMMLVNRLDKLWRNVSI